MLFLIQYDRRQGRMISFKEYDDIDRSTAESDRLHLELELRDSQSQHEVVLLEAASREALRLTHARYFEDLAQLVKAS